MCRDDIYSALQHSMLMTNTRTHTGKSCMSIDASVCRSMTWYRQDSFYRSITPECRREDYSRCCEGHVMFNDCCVSEYICTLTMLGIYALYYWVRWMCCDLHVLMKGVLHVEYLLRCFQYWILGSIAIIMRLREDCYNI